MEATEAPRSESLTPGSIKIFTKELTTKLDVQDEEAFPGTEKS